MPRRSRTAPLAADGAGAGAGASGGEPAPARRRHRSPSQRHRAAGQAAEGLVGRGRAQVADPRRGRDEPETDPLDKIILSLPILYGLLGICSFFAIAFVGCIFQLFYDSRRHRCWGCPSRRSSSLSGPTWVSFIAAIKKGQKRRTTRTTYVLKERSKPEGTQQREKRGKWEGAIARDGSGS